MESKHFDQFVRRFAEAGTRRGVLRFLVAATLGLGSPTALRQDDPEARGKRRHKHGHGHRHRRKKRRGGRGNGGSTIVPTKGLREICTPGVDTCGGALQCATPTTRHTCSDTVAGVNTWCCVPPGGSCTECDCCGDFYCEFDANNQPHCVPNPEG
jgi:hypothetical protein